jgi:GTPase SAR1 family protein
MEKSISENQKASSQLPSYKLVLVGETNVGKTSIINRYKN